MQRTPGTPLPKRLSFIYLSSRCTFCFSYLELRSRAIRATIVSRRAEKLRPASDDRGHRVTYNAANQMLTGVDTRTYNVLGQLTSISAGSGENLTYNYPSGANNGMINSMYNAVSGETVSYTYDSLNRLLTANGSGWGQQYGYDSFGNLWSKTITAGSGPSLSQTVNLNNQIVGGSYDANGNTTSVANGGLSYGLGYDPENRLAYAAVSSDSEEFVSYAYDAQNRRNWIWPATEDTFGNQINYTVNAYTPGGQKLGAYTLTPLYNQQLSKMVMQVTATSNDTYFGSRRLAVLDQLGSVVKATSPVVSYFPWGETKGASNPQDTWNYATYWQDSTTSLDYANNRYYSNVGGRFMTPDPYQASGGPSDPGSWNRYTYTRGDPVNRNDAQGLDDCETCVGGGGGGDPGGGDPGFGGDPTGYCPPSEESCAPFPGGGGTGAPGGGGSGGSGSAVTLGDIEELETQGIISNWTAGSTGWDLTTTPADVLLITEICAAQPVVCAVVGGLAVGGAIIYVTYNYGPTFLQALNQAIHRGRQGSVGDNDIIAEMNEIIRQAKLKGIKLTPCQALAQMQADAKGDRQEQIAIKTVQKAYGCSGGDR